MSGKKRYPLFILFYMAFEKEAHVLYVSSCFDLGAVPDDRRPRWPNFKQNEEFYNITIFF